MAWKTPKTDWAANDVLGPNDFNRIEGNTLDNHERLNGHLSDGTQHAKTVRFVIGTSTAGWTEKDCDYLCDGINDQVEINDAIAALPTSGGEVVILDGTYNFTGRITVNKDNVSIRGNGNATVLKRMWDSSSSEGVITLTSVQGCRVENLQIDGNNTTYTSNYNYGIHLVSSSNNIITGNTCNNSNNGIRLYSCSNNTVTSNTCYNNDTGIYLAISSNNIVTANTCIRGTGTPGDYTTNQHTILLSTDTNYNLVTSNNCMGKAPVVQGGTGNTVFNNKWDASNDIDVSDIPGLVDTNLALGQDASAAGLSSTALGHKASARENYSVALGNNALATRSSSVALGSNALATENYSVALGYNASAAGLSSVALGDDALAGFSSVALGYNASATGASSVALGRDTSAENNNEGILGGTGSSSTSNWIVPGSFTVNGTKNFEIPHPKPEKKTTHVIRHGAVESPTPGDTLYRWKVQATKDNDLVTIDLPDYFVWLNKDVQIWVTGQGHFGNGYGTLNRETEQLEIHCQLAGEYNVLVIGTRNDDHESVQNWSIKGVEREIGESWTGETYAFSVNEIIEIEEIKEVSA